MKLFQNKFQELVEGVLKNECDQFLKSFGRSTRSPSIGQSEPAVFSDFSPLHGSFMGSDPSRSLANSASSRGEVCLTTTQMVGDLCRALEGKIVSYCDTILQAGHEVHGSHGGACGAKERGM